MISNTVLNEIVLITSAIVGIAAVWKIVIPFFKWVGRVMSDVQDHMSMVRDIAAELKPNGGSSIKDSVNRIEANLAKTDARQWAVVMSLDDPISELNSSGHLVRANRSYLDFVGQQPEDVMRSGWTNHVHPDDRERVAREWAEAVKNGSTYEGHHRVVTPSGTYEVWGTARPFFNPADKSVMGWIGRFNKAVKIEDVDKVA